MFRIPNFYQMDMTFRIPNFYKMEMTFEEAKNVLDNGNGLLDGMERISKMWEQHCNKTDAEDDDFYDTWIYEVNAFNKVVSFFA